MNNLRLALIFFILISLNADFVLAETIILKSGEKVEGKIVEKGDTYIKVDFYGVPLTHYLTDIESIDGRPVAPAQIDDSLGSSPKIPITPGNEKTQKFFIAKKAMEQGISCALKGDYKRASAYYEDALRIDPKFYLAMFLWGTAQDKLGKPADAAAAHFFVLFQHPFYLKMIYARWIIYRQEGLFKQAISDLDNKIKNDPSGQKAYNARGFLYILEGNLTKAMEYFNTAISLNPGYAEAYVNRGLLYNMHLQDDLAQANYDKAIALNPQCAEAYFNLGLKLIESQPEEALVQLNKAIEIDPKNELAYLAAGMLEERGRDVSAHGDAAINLFTKVLSINPDNFLAYCLRARQYCLKGSMVLGLDDCSKAIALYPDAFAAYMIRADIYKRLGERDKSFADLNKVRDLMSSNGFAKFGLDNRPGAEYPTSDAQNINNN